MIENDRGLDSPCHISLRKPTHSTPTNPPKIPSFYLPHSSHTTLGTSKLLCQQSVRTSYPAQTSLVLARIMQATCRQTRHLQLYTNENHPKKILSTNDYNKNKLELVSQLWNHGASTCETSQASWLTHGVCYRMLLRAAQPRPGFGVCPTHANQQTRRS
jgi:hypothetical protein